MATAVTIALVVILAPAVALAAWFAGKLVWHVVLRPYWPLIVGSIVGLVLWCTGYGGEKNFIAIAAPAIGFALNCIWMKRLFPDMDEW